MNPTQRKKCKSSPDVIEDVTENIVDRNLELTDPTPDIQNLFKSLDIKCFAGLLSKNNVKVKWSTSIDLWEAGNCRTDRWFGKKLISIKLNERLLKFRTRRDLVEILLVDIDEFVHINYATFIA